VGGGARRRPARRDGYGGVRQDRRNRVRAPRVMGRRRRQTPTSRRAGAISGPSRARAARSTRGTSAVGREGLADRDALFATVVGA
jgi:hypothetical protein